MIIDKIQIINRFKEVKKIKSDAELSNYLGISRSTLSNWKARNTIDFDILFAKCEQESIDWLLTGEGNMFRSLSSKSIIGANNIMDSKDVKITPPTDVTEKDKVIMQLVQTNAQLVQINTKLTKKLNNL